MGWIKITDVELNTKEWKRVLGWYSMLASKKKSVEADDKLFRKIQIIYEAEKDFEDSIEED